MVVKKIIGTGLLVAGLSSVAFAGGLPMRSLGHGIVCTKDACSITFPKKVSYISIYKWHCRKDSTECRSSLFVDLHGSYKNMPVFFVKDTDPNSFLYRVISASKYDSKTKDGRRRFVMEFRTDRLPIVAFDYETSTLEIIRTGDIVKSRDNANTVMSKNDGHKPKKRKVEQSQAQAKKVQNTKKIEKVAVPKTKTTVMPPPKKKEIDGSVAVGTATGRSATPKTNAKITAQVEKKTEKPKSNGEVNINAKHLQQDGKNKIVVDLGKIKADKKAEPQKTTVKAKPQVLSFEQMGDEMVKKQNYTAALGWYEIALKHAASKMDRERIKSKIGVVFDKIKD